MSASSVTGPCAPQWSHRAGTVDAGDTRALAGALAELCRPGDVILLTGGLGAGKTTFAQGFARSLGVREPVTSPTFTLVRHYDLPAGRAVRQLLHADVYRLESLAEVVDLGLPELADDGAVVLVEWGDAAAPVLGESALTVSLGLSPATTGDEPADERRDVVVAGRGPQWADRAAAVGAALRPFRPPDARRAGAR